MGIETDADRTKDDILTKTNELINLIEVFVNPDTWGHEEYSSDYMERVEEYLHNLRGIRRRLT